MDFLSLNDGRKELYQWDIGRKASVSIDCDIVHFSNLTFGEALAVEVIDGTVDIPNELLMSGVNIFAWALVQDDTGAYTKQRQELKVSKRAKPTDYVYTETEAITVTKAVENALQQAKDSGEFDGADGKDAYETAKEGGYTGTEEEFSRKLAQDTSLFVITITGDEESGYTADKTYGKILAAYNAGCRLVCNLGNMEKLPLSHYRTGSILSQGFVFSSTNKTNYYTVSIERIMSTTAANTRITVSKGTYATGVSSPLLINGLVYDGSDAVLVDTRNFVVTVSADQEGGLQASATYDEIAGAVGMGRTVVCYLEYGAVMCPLVLYPTDGVEAFGFAIGLGASVMGVMIERDNSVTDISFASQITIGNQSWEGDVVDFTDTINEMIDAKLAAFAKSQEQ